MVVSVDQFSDFVFRAVAFGTVCGDDVDGTEALGLDGECRQLILFLS